MHSTGNENQQIIHFVQDLFGPHATIVSMRQIQRTTANFNQEMFKSQAHEVLMQTMFGPTTPNLIALHHYVSLWPSNLDIDIVGITARADPSHYVYLAKCLTFCQYNTSKLLETFENIVRKEMDCEAFWSVCRMIVSCLTSLQKELSSYLVSGLPAHKMLSLRGEMVRFVKDEKFAAGIMQQSKDMFFSTHDSTVALHCVHAFTAAAVFAPEHDAVLETLFLFMLRDFNTKVEAEQVALRTSFQRIHEKIVKNKKNEHFCAFFAAKLEKFSLASPLKRWIVVEILPLCTIDPAELLDLSQEQGNLGFVAKCVTSLSQTALADQLLALCMAHTDFITLEPILGALFQARPEFIDKAFGQAGENEWLLANIFLSLPKIPADLAPIRSLISRSSCRSEVRVKKFRLYTRLGLPKNEDDVALLVNQLDALLFTASQIQQSLIVTEFTELSHSLAQFSKRHAAVNVDAFVTLLVARFTKLLAVTQSGRMRKFGGELLQAVYRYFPVRKPAAVPRQRDVITTLPDFSRLAEFRKSLEYSDADIADAIPQLLGFAQQDPHKDVLNEVFLTISALCKQGKMPVEHIVQAAQYIFNCLVDTRKVGLVRLMSDTLREVVSLCYETDLPTTLANELIALLGQYDMSSMRRSAGLPFIAHALIKSEPPQSRAGIFSKLANALVTLVKSTENEKEAANALNVLGAVVYDEADNDFLANFFDALIDVAMKFHSWDITSAVDHALVGFVRRVWKTHGTKYTVTLEEFQLQINGLPALERGLKAGGHAAYLSMLMITLFPPEPNAELSSLILPFLSNRASRFRRIAARALTVVGYESLPTTHDSNTEHGRVLMGQSTRSKIPFIIADTSVICEYNSSMTTHDLIVLLRNFQGTQIAELIPRLKADVLIPTPNEALSQLGLPFLVQHETPFDGATLTSLIQSAKNDERLAGLIGLLPFATDLDIEPLVPILYQVATRIEEEQVNARYALARVLDLLLPREAGYAIGLLLVVCDIPGVRLEATRRLTGGSEVDSARECLRHLSAATRRDLCLMWARKLAATQEEEDAMTVVCDELMLLERLTETAFPREGTLLEVRAAAVKQILSNTNSQQ